MTVKGLFSEAVRNLEEAGIDEAAQDAAYLLDELCHISRADILLKGDEAVDIELERKFSSAIEMRSRHIPCQYITGRAYFMGYCFIVNENVLIPRQDTEVLAEQALDFLKTVCTGREKNLTGAGIYPKVLDVCTGSGCIAISIKAMHPHSDVTATDISEEALSAALENAERILQVSESEGESLKKQLSCYEHGVRFMQGDLMDCLDDTETFDLIVSNPPYIGEDEYAALAPEVAEHEPAIALLAGREGMDIYERLIPQAAGHLRAGGALMLEIGCSQADKVTKLMEKYGFADIKTVKDLAGLDRVVMGEKRCLINYRQ